jgi:hypothetical protein
MGRTAAGVLVALVIACRGGEVPNAYEGAGPRERAAFKRMPIPLPSGTTNGLAREGESYVAP